ncbi:MAG TPA: ATP-binding protein [Solirubrobacteraceae bacterium]|nr:ATP-binding protein [Solirubrobacteraceae bacterium]
MAEERGILLELRLPCDEQAPGAVREALSGVADGDSAFGDAMLVASELVTNAVQHSGCNPQDQLEVLVAHRERQLIISVLDPGVSQGTARPNGSADEGFGGFGLMVIQQLASQWGEERGEGYRVWARLPLG